MFLVDKIFEDSASNDVSANPKATDGKLFGVGSHSIDSGTNDVNKNNEPTLHKQTSMEEQWLHNEVCNECDGACLVKRIETYQ